MKTASSARRTLVNNHPLSRKRSSLPSTQGIIWIVFSVVLAISSSLLLLVLYLVNDPSATIPGTGNGGAKPNLLEPHYSVNAAQARSKFDLQAETVITQLRADFEHRYGKYATQIRQKGLQRFVSSSDPHATAGRILRAAANRRPFRMAFAGYSVTVGRGNFFQQSYPFVLQHILQPAFTEIFQMKLLVRNAAIGGIPSFPYGFCLEHFLGPTPDVISWDFSMNELGRDNTAVLEAYIRHSQHQLSQTRPMIISLDTHRGRCDLLQQYTQQNLLQDALCVGKADAVFGKSDLESFDKQSSAKSSTLPTGLQEWSEFGAPRNCPGRSGWHPKKKEHEMIAWIIAMEFVDALEQAARIAETDPNWILTYKDPLDPSVRHYTPKFPKPLSRTLPDNQHAPAIERLLFGHAAISENGGNDKDEYQIHHVSCRTNFLPATDHTKVLSNIVISGLASGLTADNIMTPRTDQQYTKGWVLDVSTLERETKVKVENCGGLGYEDMKIALYGVPESGPLRLWLPIELPSQGGNNKKKQKKEDLDLSATHWLDSVILCEANEKRSADACQLDHDLELQVGGVAVPSSSIVVMHGAGEYLKRPTCVHVTIPETSRMTPLDQLQTMDQKPLHDETKQRLLQGLSSSSVHKKKDKKPSSLLGLVVDVRAASRVTRSAGACCLSHVAWEMH
ncbi:hypothetical protein ACA910_018014 [Epithemia clementina (nom. ined.)]